MDKDSMDTITFTSEEDDESWKIVEERMKRMVDDLLREDLGEDNEEQTQEMCVGVSELSMGKRDVLEDDTAFSGAENRMDSSMQQDERGYDDSAWRMNEPGKNQLWLMFEVPKRITEDEEEKDLRKKVEDIKKLNEFELEEFWREMEELLTRKDMEGEMEQLRRRILDAYCFACLEKEDLWEFERRKQLEREELEKMKELERAEFGWKMEDHIKYMEKQKQVRNRRGMRAKTKSQKKGQTKMEAPMNSSDAAHLFGENLNTKDTEAVENKEDMKNKSDRETGFNLLDRSFKESWDDSSDDESTSSESSRKEEVHDEPKLEKSNARSCKKKSHSVKMRSPVICLLGHVDTGKTKLLDFIRKTHVQDAEAGGITQQIGATMIPQEALREKCKMANDFSTFDLNLPGLLVIDTPGHESFRNLRSRGTSMCDMAVLVVDIMRGLELQTIESINLLRNSKTPFVVALNKVDQLYGWKSSQDSDVESTVNRQGPATQNEFKKRCQEVIAQFANEYLNAALFYENSDPHTFVSIVPTSAISGDGMGNLMSLIAKLAQTRMHKKLVFSRELKATVMEVKAIPGLGTTVDVVLVNGRLREGDTIVMGGREGPVVGQIRSLLTPHPLKEMRMKNQYVEHKSIKGAQGVKITGKGLEKAIAGLPLFVARKPNDVAPLKRKTTALMEQVVKSVNTSNRGVYVQASTLGSLEAFLEYLTSIDIPYFEVKIGPVVKKDVMKAYLRSEGDVQYATILAFDVKVEREAQKFADAIGVKIFSEDVIYRAGDKFLEYREKCLKEKEEVLSEAVFPCLCEVLTLGKTSFEILVEIGYLRVGTPLLARDRQSLKIGVVTSISAADGSSVDMARAGDKVKIQVKTSSKKPVEVIVEERLISSVSRKSYDLCKKYCRKDFSREEWVLMLQLRKAFNTVNWCDVVGVQE